MENGTLLNQYRIAEKLGEGGMGQVFRAEDTRLKREVAIKVLPAEVAGDPERIARMEREAQVLASLEHPNIAAIYGIEEAEYNGMQVRFLAMQLAEGSTLADRIAEGPVLLGEALQIALQIAEGLEAAHDKGVVHRDLKPANIQLGTDGTVKLLDFGLAKAVDGRKATTGIDLTASPTVLEATRQGVIMGTAGYMSPEQARGYTVDQRTDIWAFGAVMYEMLAGRTVFAGETATDVLGAIVHREPDWKLLPAITPRRIQMLMKRCLRKDPKRRLQAIGDARVTIIDYLEDPVAAEAFAGGEATPAWQRWLPWGVAAALAIALIAANLLPGAAPPGQPVVRSEIPLDMEALYAGPGGSVSISPNGRYLVAQAEITNLMPQSDLVLRPLAEPTFTTLITGQHGDPFFSPDNEWIVFTARDALFKVPVSGGTPQRIADVQRARGAHWGGEDTIVFAGSPGGGLSSVSALGGAPVEITTLDTEQGEVSHRWPHLLPGGEAVLFSVGTDSGARSIALAEIGGETHKQIYPNGTDARYLPTGHIVFADAASLFAAPFDLDRREISGAAIPVVEGVFTDGAGRAHWGVSDNGVLVYRSGTIAIPTHPIAAVTADGQQRTLWSDAATYLEPRLSPDGTRLAVCQMGPAGLDIWVYDIARQVPTRLTFGDGDDCPAVWSPDGEQVIFSSAANGALDLYRKRADGSGEVERLTEDTGIGYYVSDWSPDGEHVILTVGNGDLMTLALADGEDPQSYLETDFSEAEADFSPDGRWVAYHSNETGRNEVYVRPFPAGDGKWQISTGGGAYPRWSRDGGKVFYRTAQGIADVDVTTADGALSIGNASEMFTGSFRGGLAGIPVNGSIWADWAVGTDGEFILFPAPDASSDKSNTTLQVVTNWFDELNRRVPIER